MWAGARRMDLIISCDAQRMIVFGCFNGKQGGLTFSVIYEALLLMICGFNQGSSRHIVLTKYFSCFIIKNY